MAWVDDYAPSMGAALAYYTLFSIAPLLIIVIAVAGLVFGQEAVRGEIVAQLQGLIGQEGAIAVQGLLKNVNQPAQSIFATVVSIITLVIGATTVFGELQSDLDRIWRVPASVNESSSLWSLLRNRLLSFGFVLGLVFLLLLARWLFCWCGYIFRHKYFCLVLNSLGCTHMSMVLEQHNQVKNRH